MLGQCFTVLGNSTGFTWASGGRSFGNDWTEAAEWVVELWPIPMVALDVDLVEVTAEELAERLEALLQEMMDWYSVSGQDS
jgi:hypothetical protein